MKKINFQTVIMLTIALVAIQLSVLAQGTGTFQGSINYTITLKGDMAEMMSSAMPKNTSVKIKGKNTRTRTDAAMPLDILRLDKVNYNLDHEGKKANKMPDYQKAEEAAASKFKVTATGKKVTIIGYPCDEYIVTIVDGDRSINSYVYTTTKINAQKFGGSMFEIGSKVKGVPLRMVMTVPITETSKVDMTMEVTSIKEENIPDSEFMIPLGYEVVEVDPSKMIPGMGGRK
jgi:Domain of unknown function (DUF4412)